MTNARERFKDLNVIGVDYHMYDEKADEEYNQLNYLCITDNGLYFFEPSITEYTMVFEDIREAINYIYDHNLQMSICYDNIRVLSLIKEI